MKRLFVAIGLLTVFALTVNNNLFAKAESPASLLKMVTIEAKSVDQIKKLSRMGIDITAVRKGPVIKGNRGAPAQTYQVEAVVSDLDEKALSGEGFRCSDKPGKGPVKKIGKPYAVYKSFDAPRLGIKAQMRKLAATYPHLCRIKKIGYSIQGRKILAMGLTNEKIKTDKPQVLFLATHHAREWVATEMSMRLMKYLTSNYGSDGRVTDLLNTTEVWVIPVANPDGYQYTFTKERLWRKNLRDNDGDGQITITDGVDLNRNFDSHWGYDDEGSSPIWSSGQYRGLSPNSEPETQAVTDFIQDNNFKFVVSYHTYGNLILYPWGWQVKTSSFDDPIFVAQAGTDANPAIWDSRLNTGYDPGVGADLYTMNGEFTDWCYYTQGIPSYMVELTNDYDFRFPDDEDKVQTVFLDNLEFALSIAESAANPAHPISPVGIATQDVYHTPVTASFGPDQVIEVLARKGLDLTLIASGGTATSFTEKLGSTYNEKSGAYYSRYLAYINGQSAGNKVTYSISYDGSLLGPYAYDVVYTTGNPILLMAAEDYGGEFPTYADQSGPNYLHYYTGSLDAGSRAYDVWDVDDRGVPSYAEVLSHYEVVIWYTADDYFPTVPTNYAHENEVLEVRKFINYDDGKLFATGQDLAWSSAIFGMFSDDFFQYYLGAYEDIDTGGINSNSKLPFDVRGVSGDPIFDGLDFSLSDGDGANNQCCSSTFLVTSYFLPNFDNVVAASYVRPGSPFEPHSGDYYVYSHMADISYKRLGGNFTLPEGSPTLTFWISYDIEYEWDYAFVEISELGTDNWTTLPDSNDLTSSDTGMSCLSGWVEQIHPFLSNYMDDECNSTGKTGSWNAFTGDSGGWQQVAMDLSDYAGKTVELYISYVTDWGGTHTIGATVDDIELSGYPIEDFEAGMGEWTVNSPPPGSDAFNNWVRISGAYYPEGSAIRTDNSLYLGFGFEAIDTAANRNALMDRVMTYFGQ